MPKRTNPYGEQSPLQYKSRIGQKEVDLGVNADQNMKLVYERTKQLLFTGAQKHHNTPQANGDAADVTNDMEVEAPSCLPGQMCLNKQGQLAAPSAVGVTVSAMTLDESEPMTPDVSHAPGQMCLGSRGHLTPPSSLGFGVTNNNTCMECQATECTCDKKAPVKAVVDLSVLCQSCDRVSSMTHACTFCERRTCGTCMRRCGECDDTYCSFCSVINVKEPTDVMCWA